MDSKLKCVFEEGGADTSPKVCLTVYAAIDTIQASVLYIVVLKSIMHNQGFI